MKFKCDPSLEQSSLQQQRVPIATSPLIVIEQLKIPLIIIEQMELKKRIKRFIKSLDLFSQPVTFRYADQPSYQSFTGGVCSIIVVIIFIVIFAGTALNTFERVYVESKMTRFNEENPSYYSLNTDNFPFAVRIDGVNMNEGDRWFDITFQSLEYSGLNRSKISIPLQPCRKERWTRIIKNFSNVYDKLQFDQWLCAPDNVTLELQGKYSSNLFKFYRFIVSQCKPSLDPTRPCVNNSVIEKQLDLEQVLKFNFYFVNAYINPNSRDNYLSFFLDDFNYIAFTPTLGASSNLFVSSYTVNTDESITPFQNVTEKAGCIVLQPAQILNLNVRNTQYVKFYIRKSSQAFFIERRFRKVDDTLSYIGGLFSAILGMLFFMNLYNEFSYELEMAKNCYHFQKNLPLNPQGFTFFVYLGYLVYMLFDKFGISLPWRRMRMYHHSLEEVRKQMDIRLIMKKILYSERMSNVVLNEHKTKILHLQQPMTLEEAETIRKDYRIYDKIQDIFFDYEKLHSVSEAKMLNESSSCSNNNKKVIPFLETENNMKTLESQETSEKIKKYFGNPEKQKQFEMMIERLSAYYWQIKIEASRGDEISSRILDKFDSKVKLIFSMDSKDMVIFYPSNPCKEEKQM